MFKNMIGEGHLSGGQSPASPADHGVASPGLNSQESSWISMVSRPAVSFLQKYLPGRPLNSALPHNVAGWFSGDLKHNFVDEEQEFLGQLDDMLPLQHPAPPLAYLGCQHDGLMKPRSGSTPHWLTADSLREMGIQDVGELDVTIGQQTQIGYLSTARSFFTHVLVSPASTQEVRHSSLVKSVGRTWWGGFWRIEGSPQSLSSHLSWGKEGTVTGQHCPLQPVAGTKATTTELFVQSSSSSRASMPGENAGHAGHKEEPADNGCLQTAQPEALQALDASTPNHQPIVGICSHLICSGAATACSEVALPPEQDNGYSSLEEELAHVCHLFMLKAHCGDEPQEVAESNGDCAAMKTGMEGEISEEGDSTPTPVKGVEVEERQEVMEGSDISGSVDECEEETPSQEGPSMAATAVTTPRCQNKAIAYIMGSPCSDEDDSQSDGESSEDDDGFDSEGSSELSKSDDGDDDSEHSDSDTEANSEPRRLLRSLCQSQDQYNPQNFTASLRTSSTAPRTIPAAASASPHSTPGSSPDQAPSPLSCSPVAASPPQSSDTWDDSTSDGEADEAESLRLWMSFSSTSDPYSPLNFQASLWTRAPGEAGARARSRAKKTSPCHTAAMSPPQYKKEEAEERLDSGFSEHLASTVASPTPTTSTTPACVSAKKVRFCEEVEEFFASCGEEEEEEDRHGPWEELARDRCRFLRRCQEVEMSIAYCLQPGHRSLVLQSRSVCYSQGA